MNPNNSFLRTKEYPIYKEMKTNTSPIFGQEMPIQSLIGEGQTTGLGGEIPINTVCPNCNQYVESIVRHKIGKSTWITSIALSFVLMCWVPFCFTPFKEPIHYCPKCFVQLTIANEIENDQK